MLVPVGPGWLNPLTHRTSHWFCFWLQILRRKGLWSGDRERKEGYLEQTLLVSGQHSWFSSYLFHSSLLSPCLLAMYIKPPIFSFLSASPHIVALSNKLKLFRARGMIKTKLNPLMFDWILDFMRHFMNTNMMWKRNLKFNSECGD